mgnify:CR=1 FL=1|nr:MAG TPA: holin [Caudoviricetes sp.]
MEITAWIDAGVKILFLVISVCVTVYVVPWLKERELYSTVKQMVQAAEKWNETHPIDKKQYVMERLEARGVTVNPYIEALIESAVKELDIALRKAADAAAADEEAE